MYLSFFYIFVFVSMHEMQKITRLATLLINKGLHKLMKLNEQLKCLLIKLYV